MSYLTCSPTMLPNLATMSANKFRSQNVRGMLVYAQNIFANNCCSMECCLIWPLCRPTNSGHKMFAVCLYMLKTFSRTIVVQWNVVQFGHYVGQQIQVTKCSRYACICSKHFREQLLFNGMLSNLATMFANNSTHSDKSYGINMRKSLTSIVPSMSLVAEWIVNQRRKG